MNIDGSVHRCVSEIPSWIGFTTNLPKNKQKWHIGMLRNHQLLCSIESICILNELNMQWSLVIFYIPINLQWQWKHRIWHKTLERLLKFLVSQKQVIALHTLYTEPKTTVPFQSALAGLTFWKWTPEAGAHGVYVLEVCNEHTFPADVSQSLALVERLHPDSFKHICVGFVLSSASCPSLRSFWKRNHFHF